MWIIDLKESGYYWYKYKISGATQLTICYFDVFSKTVTFVGSVDSTPIEHLNELDELTGSWSGPIKEPPLEDQE